MRKDKFIEFFKCILEVFIYYVFMVSLMTIWYKILLGIDFLESVIVCIQYTDKEICCFTSFDCILITFFICCFLIYYEIYFNEV